jgi:hypothetical protein
MPLGWGRVESLGYAPQPKGMGLMIQIELRFCKSVFRGLRLKFYNFITFPLLTFSSPFEDYP